MDVDHLQLIANKIVSGSISQTSDPADGFAPVQISADFALQGLAPFRIAIAALPSLRLIASQMVPVDTTGAQSRTLFLTRTGGGNLDDFDVLITKVDGVTPHTGMVWTSDSGSPPAPGQATVTMTSTDGTDGLLQIFNPNGFNAASVYLNACKPPTVLVDGTILVDTVDFTNTRRLPFPSLMNPGQFSAIVDTLNAVWLGQANIEFRSGGCVNFSFDYGLQPILETRDLMRSLTLGGSLDSTARHMYFFSGIVNTDGEPAASTQTVPPFITVMPTSSLPPANTCAHEIGHSMGLDDVSDNTNIMFISNAFNGFLASVDEIFQVKAVKLP